MLRNIIGPVFNFRNVFFFSCFFCLFFKNPLCSAWRMRFSKKKKNKKNKKMDQFLTLKRANLGPVFNFTAYIYVVKLKAGPFFALFRVKNRSICFVFFLFLKNLTLHAEKDDVSKKTKTTKTSFQCQKLVQFVAQHTGPVFNFDLDQFLT